MFWLQRQGFAGNPDLDPAERAVYCAHEKSHGKPRLLRSGLERWDRRWRRFQENELHSGGVIYERELDIR